jgi:hypothetical protein
MATQVITVLGNNFGEAGAENRAEGTQFKTHHSSLVTVNPNPTTDRIWLDLTDFRRRAGNRFDLQRPGPTGLGKPDTGGGRFVAADQLARSGRCGGNLHRPCALGKWGSGEAGGAGGLKKQERLK